MREKEKEVWRTTANILRSRELGGRMMSTCAAFVLLLLLLLFAFSKSILLFGAINNSMVFFPFFVFFVVVSFGCDAEKGQQRLAFLHSLDEL